MSLLEVLKLAQPQIYFAKMNPNIKAAKALLRPVLKSPISQVLISFVVGYYATTRIVKIFSNKCTTEEKLPKERGTSQQSEPEQSAIEHLNIKNNSSNNNQTSKSLPTGDNALLLTLHQLMAYDGLNHNKPIYTALNGKIYDLTPSREKFANRGPYSLLAGCNANHVLGIACGSMGVCADDLVQRWEQSLNAEFNVIGYLIESNEFDAEEDELFGYQDLLDGKVDGDEDDTSTVVGQSDPEATSSVGSLSL
ncbi:uncharacterized protein LOC115631857 [Scaptodrosophila lebanonensis]|uniref:Uncharacterized protein LOC115631857 n=1 Tax=Drosophila lebanonensis TaxID=7225 RepID=A0A6J2UAR0_DROLE|nr:uncharacterized protein LOC115631857 [Scaptodrosophila lebanonensis]